MDLASVLTTIWLRTMISGSVEPDIICRFVFHYLIPTSSSDSHTYYEKLRIDFYPPQLSDSTRQKIRKMNIFITEKGKTLILSVSKLLLSICLSVYHMLSVLSVKINSIYCMITAFQSK